VLPSLRAQARRDPKTGLLNVRGFREAAEPELARARRFERPVALIMADVDNLREINNNYGHLAGDNALTAVTSMIRGAVREYDICARFGGDEFVILLPETTADAAHAIARRICGTTLHLDVDTSLHVDVSVGVAAPDEHERTLDELLHLADAEMYRHKRSGTAYAVASEG
jgi:diguanylate cyclase (GGDEF)-like protein